MIVLDAPALLEVLLARPAGEAVSDRIFAERGGIHAPHLLDVEVLQVLRRYALSGAIDAARGALAVDDLRDFPLDRHPHEPLLDRVWELRHGVTAYDAVYLALAEALDATLITCDRKLTSVKGHGARIEVVSG